jgi:NTP pyrophosphatase (non-canonical NTP hydrolase)
VSGFSLDEYQARSSETVIHHADPLMDKTIFALGLAGEAGEVVEKWKKLIIYRNGIVTDADKTEIKKELGDALWYIAQFARALDIPLSQVAEFNLEKLASRKKRGVQKGAGDNR